MRRSMRLVALAVALPFLPATGQVLGPEFRVNTYTTNAQYKSRIAASPNGDFVVVWQSTNQETGPSAADGVFAQPFDISIALGTELQINSYTSNQQNIPDVASDSNGNFVVVWRDYQEGSSFGVFARRFNSSGFAQGAEFRVNAYTSSNQGFAHVAATPAGSFVVVWQGIGPGGTASSASASTTRRRLLAASSRSTRTRRVSSDLPWSRAIRPGTSWSSG